MPMMALAGIAADAQDGTGGDLEAFQPITGVLQGPIGPQFFAGRQGGGHYPVTIGMNGAVSFVSGLHIHQQTASTLATEIIPKSIRHAGMVSVRPSELEDRSAASRTLARSAPRTRMRVLSWLLVWWAAALTSSLWTADLRAGPWQVLAGDGSVVVGTRWVVAPGESISGVMTLADQQLPMAVERFPGGAVLTVRKPVALAATAGELLVGDRRLVIPGVQIPAPGTPATVVVLGPGQDLTAAFVTAIQAVAPAESAIAVLLVGGHRSNRIESTQRPGTWPIILLGAGPDLIELERLAPGGVQHALATFGALGLPTAVTMLEWPRVVARDLSPWTVPVVTGAPWDPALFADPGRSSAETCRDLVGLFDGLGHPAALLIGSRVGFISEPLGLVASGISVRAGGVRLIGASPAGDGVAGLDGHIASAIEGDALGVLSADAQNLRLTFVRAPADPATDPTSYPNAVVPIRWERGRRPALGWGGGDVEAAWRSWNTDPTTAISADLAWAIPRTYDVVTPGSSQRESLIAAAASDPFARVTATRMLVRGDANTVGVEPEWLRRVRVLRDLGARSVHAGSPAAIDLPTTPDLRLVHAAIRCADGRARAPILDSLTRRLQLQATGEVPFASDPLDQHRLVSAVFDASDRSPTPLRALGRALVEKLDPLSRGPVERFLAAAGTFRLP